MDGSLPGPSVLEISQARILEWVAISFSRRASGPRDQTFVSCTGRQIFYNWATREAFVFLGKTYCPTQFLSEYQENLPVTRYLLWNNNHLCQR